MPLRTKVIALLVVMFCLFVGTDVTIQRNVFLPEFQQLERDEATKDIVRCREALAREVEHLGFFCQDWASWDDTYEFVLDGNEDYVTDNLVDETYIDAKLDLIFVVDLEGRVVGGTAFDSQKQKEIAVREFPRERLPTNAPLLQHATLESNIKGIMMTDHGPLMVASYPVITSENKGPIRGTLIMGRLLTERIAEQLREQTRVDLHMWPVTDTAMPEEDRVALGALSPSNLESIVERGDNLLAAYSASPDIHGAPVVLLRADVPREISRKGQSAMRFATSSVFVAGFATLIVLLVLTQWSVVGPISRLTKHATGISASGDLNAQLKMERSDEVGVLAGEFDLMVTRLAELQRSLVDASRKAGKAEVASDVLHNVGNVLNSVNVSATKAVEQVRDIGVADVAEVAKLLRQHKDDLGAFLNDDEKGKLIPSFLDELGTHLVDEQGTALEELKSLAANVDHIKEVVNMQQEYAKAADVFEVVHLRSVVDDAVRINDAAMRRHGVHLEVNAGDLPDVRTDSHRVLQIVVNLLSNAKYATSAANHSDKAIRVEASADDDANRVSIQVSDNGVGIAPENLTRIFSHGYTTREKGHGFGLHSAAIAAKELGGTLTAESDGPGHGATFVLELPFDMVPAAI